MARSKTVIGSHLFKGKNEFFLMTSFCLGCCEIFFLYRNFRIPSNDMESLRIPLFGSFVAVISALVFYTLLLVMYNCFKKKIGSGTDLLGGCACSFVAPIVQLFFGHILQQKWVVLPCIVVAAAGFACLLPELVKRLAAVGVACSIRSNIAACCVLMILAPLSNYMPLEIFIIIMSLIPLAMLWCLNLAKISKKDPSLPEEQHQKIPKILLCTVVAASVMEGVVAAVDDSTMATESKLLIFTSAYVIAAILMALVLLFSRENYNNVIFRICFPLMATGLSVFVFGGSVALDLGTLIFLVGRQLFAATTLALVVYLVRYHGSDYYLLSVSVILGAMLGSCAGIGLYALGGQADRPLILPPAFIVYVLMIVLFVAIYLTSASNLKTRWGMVVIDDSENKKGMTFEQSCSILAKKRGLTARESEIVTLIAKGRDKQAIARKLFISEGTVKVHSRNIYQKIGIHSKQELIDLVELTEESIKE